MKFNLRNSLSAVLVAAVAFSAGRFSTPAEVEIKEVEKIVYRERSETQKDVDKEEIVHPDGTKVTRTITSTKRVKDKDIESDKQKQMHLENRPSWMLGVQYFPASNGVQDRLVSVSAHRRMIGEVYLGIVVSERKDAAVSLLIGF